MRRTFVCYMRDLATSVPYLTEDSHLTANQLDRGHETG